MSNEKRPISTDIKTYQIIGLWTVVFIAMSMTGNCSFCGFETDYIAEYLETR